MELNRLYLPPLVGSSTNRSNDKIETIVRIRVSAPFLTLRGLH